MPAGDEPTHDVTRRDALKKLGLAAGIAWSAPVVMTFSKAAGASTGTPAPATTAETTTVPPIACDGGTCRHPVGCSGGRCFCATDAAGVGRCIPNSTKCDPLATCGPDNSCPPGFFCAIGTCCRDENHHLRPVCIPLATLARCPPDGFAPQRADLPWPGPGSRTVAAW